ncbi:MAG TPA: glycosyltransferase family 2 protein [Stenomitos sp.]
MPEVTVVVPIYNVERFIQDTINSVLSQSYKDFELLLIDDNSPDSSFEICDSFNDPRIKIIRQENRGLAGARNTGIRNAKGKYIAFLDGDDLWLENKLLIHVNHLESRADIGVSFSRSAFIDESGKSLGTFQMPKLSDITPSHLLCRNPIGNGSAPVIRRQVFDKIKFNDNINGNLIECYFDEHFRQSEDIECWIRIAITTNWKIEGVPQALTLYRVNSSGLSADLERQLHSWERVIEKTYSYAPELVNRWGSLARAYQLRYLARRAVRLKDGLMATRLFRSAMAENWLITLQEPRRTFLTFIAAFALLNFPASLYNKIEEIALALTGKTQAKKIENQQANQLVG